MGFTAIVSGIFAVAKAVPIVKGYIDDFVDLYISNQIKKLEDVQIDRQHKRAYLMQSISKATTDEERKALSIILSTDI